MNHGRRIHFPARSLKGTSYGFRIHLHNDPIIKSEVDPQSEFDTEVVFITVVVINVDVIRCQTQV